MLRLYFVYKCVSVQQFLILPWLNTHQSKELYHASAQLGKIHLKDEENCYGSRALSGSLDLQQKLLITS